MARRAAPARGFCERDRRDGNRHEAHHKRHGPLVDVEARAHGAEANQQGDERVGVRRLRLGVFPNRDELFGHLSLPVVPLRRRNESRPHLLARQRQIAEELPMAPSRPIRRLA